MAKKTKILDRVGFKDCDGLTSTAPEIPEETLSAGGKVRKLVAGLGNTETERPKVNFLGQKGTKVVGNNSIYFYPGDMPGNITSGMGMVGADSETIDIVVGRMASAHGGEGPRDGMIVGNSFPNDAARIYISRFTKVDHYFGIDKRNTDPKDEVALSAIAMKADKVRIIGRYDIKLVTSGARGYRNLGKGRRELNSRGGKIPYGGRIELLAGNAVIDTPIWFPGAMLLRRRWFPHLQGVVKGNNMLGCMTDVLDMFDDIMDTISKMSKIMGPAFGALAATHPYYSTVAATCGAAQTALAVFVDDPCMGARIRGMGIHTHYLSEDATWLLRSRNVSAT